LQFTVILLLPNGVQQVRKAELLNNNYYVLVEYNTHEHKSPPRCPEPMPALLLSLAYMSYLSRTVMAITWLLHIGVRQTHSEE